MSISDGRLLSCVYFVGGGAAMTSDYVRRSVLETIGYRRLDLHGGKRRTRRCPPPPALRGGNGTAASESSASPSYVYVYGDEDGSEDEIRNEDAIELRPRNRQARPSPADRVIADDPLVGSIEVGVKEDDSLTNIALRYNCKVSDIKRLNRLIKEQDFYGLKRIRIPVIRHGVIEEQLQSEDKDLNESLKCNSSENWLKNSEFIDSPTSPSHDSQSHQAEQLLLRYDHEIQNTLTQTQFDQSNTNATIRPLLSRQISKTLNWRTVLTFFIMFCVIIPIIGGLYFILKHLFNSPGN